MSAPGPILREMHRFQKNISDLQTRIKQGPRLLDTQKKRLANEDEKVAKEKETIKALKVHIHDKEVSIKTCRDHLKRYQKQLQESSGQKEFAALRNEIETEHKKIAQLEEEILELMEDVEQRTAILPEMEQQAGKVRGEVLAFEEKHNARMQDFVAQLEQAQTNFKDAEAKLVGDAKEHYTRLTKMYGTDAMAAVENGNCTACHTGMTAQHQNDLIRGMFISCKSCGRLLYSPE